MNEVELLRTENASLRDQLDVARADYIRKDRIIAAMATMHHAEMMAMINAHHAERMELLTGVKGRLDVVMALHSSAMEQLDGIETRLTRAPNAEKVHGLAVTITPPLCVRGRHEIRILAGQADYISRKTAGLPQENFLLTFTETGIPIDVRNNFRTAANERLRENIELLDGTEAQDHGIVFRCCRSSWHDDQDIFPIEEVTEIFQFLLEDANIGMDVVLQYNRMHQSVQDYIEEQRTHHERAHAAMQGLN